jgi:hypothetical protein
MLASTASASLRSRAARSSAESAFHVGKAARAASTASSISSAPHRAMSARCSPVPASIAGKVSPLIGRNSLLMKAP